MRYRSAQYRAPLLFRKLWPGERGEFAGHLLRLGREDRLMRFCGGVSDASIRAYCARFDWTRGVVFACFAEGRLRGVGELVWRAAGAVEAEIALSVEPPFQDQGIGSELLRLALLGARNRFLATVHLHCLVENERMRHLARKSGADIVVRWGEADGVIERPWPTFLTWLEEASLEGGAFLKAAGLAAAATRSPH